MDPNTLPFPNTKPIVQPTAERLKEARDGALATAQEEARGPGSFAPIRDGQCLYVPAPGATKASLRVQQVGPTVVEIFWAYRGDEYKTVAWLPEHHLLHYVSTEHGIAVLHLKEVPQTFPRPVEVKG